MEKLFQGFAALIFAVIGMAVDQTGNPIYNEPIRLLSCPPQSELKNTTRVQHFKPGNTTITQNFTCQDENGAVLKAISQPELFLHRFVLYLVIFKVLFFANQLFVRFKRGPENQKHEVQ